MFHFHVTPEAADDMWKTSWGYMMVNAALKDDPMA